MLKINPKEVSIGKMHGNMLGAVAPRPIAFASTIDEKGNANLAPFSFFNAFSANPPILVFSPARRVRNNTTKHTLENIQKNKEVVINVVNYNIVQQMNLASTEYPEGVNEFIKSGLTPLPSEKVKPFRVKESPAHFECIVRDVVPLGEEGGAGFLVICEILLMHISDEVLREDGRIDPHKMDLVARMGENFYCRASGDAIFEVVKPLEKMGIGVDSIPENIRKSKILTGNDLGLLGNVERLPSEADIDKIKNDPEVKELPTEEGRHRYAQKLLSQGKVEEAWKVLLLGQ